nr:splicing factor 3A subunit 1-like [Hydra vulgaris]
MPPAVLGVDNNAEHEVVEDESGKLLERSQQDGELYSKPTVGIIYPPPEVRNIVDRTANFVARNGPEFEDRIRSNEATNPKFNFLNPNDPYYAYYLHKLKEYREGDLTELPSVAQTKEVKAAQKEHKVNVMEWSAQSPDLNIIENLRADVKEVVAAAKPLTKESLWNVVKETWS